MIKSITQHWIKSLPIRLGLGVVLCANYSCSTSRNITNRDPFQQQGTTQQQGSTENALVSPLIAASQPQSEKTTDDSESQQLAALQTSMQQLQTNEEIAAKVHVAEEWPALPEKRIGLTPPLEQAQYAAIAAETQLPPGGYETPLGMAEPWASSETKTAAAEFNENTIQQVSHQQQQWTQTAAPAAEISNTTATEFTPAEPRMPVRPASAQQLVTPDECPPFPGMPQTACPPFPGMSPAACLPFPGAPAVCETCDTGFYPDEYLCDGGDRGYPVHYSPGSRNGLETQDTIAEYQDASGKLRVKKTNEVCIYAPRFGAVKTVVGSSENVNVDKALGAYETINGMAMNTRLIPQTEQQTAQLNAARVRSRVSGLETETITLGVDQATKLTDHTKLENTNTDYNFAGTGGLDRWQTPTELAGIQAAAVWTRKQSPVIVAHTVAGSEAYSWFKPEEIVGLEDKSRPGELHISKSADLSSAQPGDIITFTIRYRNTGDQPLFNVQVIDNLTPRLEFIEGTATSDRDGRLIVEDNQEGSLILKWEISEEIKGKSAGTVSFRARVR